MDSSIWIWKKFSGLEARERKYLLGDYLGLFWNSMRDMKEGKNKNV